MTVECALKCGNPLNPFDIGVWKEVRGFVGGEKKDSMVLREDTGRYAHSSCVEKARAGQHPTQPELLADEPRPQKWGSVEELEASVKSDVAELEGMLGEDRTE